MQIQTNILGCPTVKKIINDVKSGVSVNVSGATIGEKTLLLSCYDKAIFFCEDFLTASAVKEGLVSLNKSVGFISSIDESMILSEIKDMTLTHNLIKNVLDFSLQKIDYLILLSGTILQRMPDKKTLLSSVVNIQKGRNYNYNNFIKKLTQIGYERCEVVENKGQFAVRGDIIDLFEIQNDDVLRISFFDDEIESISLISSELKTIKTYENYDIYPSDIYCLYNGSFEAIIDKIRNESANTKLNGDALLSINNLVGDAIGKLENRKLSSFFVSYLDFNDNILSILDETIIVIDEPKKIQSNLQFLYNSQLSSAVEMVKAGTLFSSSFDFYLQVEDALKKCKSSKLIFQNIASNDQIFDFTNKYSLKILGSEKYVFDFQKLSRDLRMLSNSSHRIVLCCGNETNINIMRDFLYANAFSFEILEKIEIDSSKVNIFLTSSPFPYSASFLDGKFIVIGNSDLFKKQQPTTLQSTNKRGVFYLPKVNDYVVHSIHGIGKCIALERLKLSGSEKDYFVIEYNGGDKLYIPSEQANSISAFTGSDKMPKLNKLGGAEFARIKERVKNSIQSLAFDLVELYKQRDSLKGYVYSPNGYLMELFEDAFEYDETPDQMEAIKQVKQDMESTKIMDRLICGDVGYGKTEVALRAIYKAVIDGKQVAFLCPTSILSEQHYQTCLKRFDGFMVRTAVLNRLRSKKEQECIIQKLRDGEIDVVCGTHRLLSNDVVFKDLGLLVLDEEQRFGVGDKEKIKNIKKQVDVISLSATPIPRTLHMSLSGIRDISIIETPPKDRLPIQTYVTEFSFSLLVDVCKRELARQGQVLVVYNRIDKINSFANELRALLPDVSIGIAHGQMTERTLENTITKLYNGDYQIMIATTLIENGVDLPMANSLFVVDSDRLGLSQLYQLRGRIGRSNRLAYAYFTYNPDKVLTEDAYKRLSAIMEYTELGSGFKIAMRDLEIRGAGNVLGKEQHGHMEKVGYDMYSKLLAEAVEEIKGNKVKELLPIKIDIDIPAFIDEKYISNQEQRIKTYTNISELKSYEQLLELRGNLISSFGDVSLATQNLLKIGLIKNLAQQLEVKRVILNDKVCQLQLYKKENIINEQTASAIDKFKDYCVLKFEDLPIINFEFKNYDVSAKLDKLISFLLTASF